ncbi:hypothetical protein [Desulfosporosinus sp. SB140]|uniref:hypothetical protein n=1 Tax=Desulfosporosinus paludis TaxID=3115649 RepID=UPI00388E6986
MAHEPPVRNLLSNLRQPIHSNAIQEILKLKGPAAAIKEFGSRVGVNISGNNIPKLDKANAENVKFFIQKEIPMLANYKFNIPELKKAKSLTAVAIGSGAASPQDGSLRLF